LYARQKQAGICALRRLRLEGQEITHHRQKGDNRRLTAGYKSSQQQSSFRPCRYLVRGGKPLLCVAEPLEEAQGR